MKKILLVWALVLSALSVNAQDWTPKVAGDHLFDIQSFRRINRGDYTWSAAFSAFIPAGESGLVQMMDAQGSIGYFIDDHIEAEGTLTWTKMNKEQGASIGAGANYYFYEGFEDTYPYIGAGLSTWFYGMKERGTRLHVKAGVRHFFSQHMGLRVWGQYDIGMTSLQEGKGVFTAYVGVFTLAH